MNLENTNLQEAVFSNVWNNNREEAILTKANLKNATLINVDLGECDLESANLENAKINPLHFS